MSERAGDDDAAPERKRRRGLGARLGDRLSRAISDDTDGAEDAVQPGDVEFVRRCVNEHSRTSMALTVAVGDKAVWRWRGERGAVVYQVRGNLLVVLHQPACAEADAGALWADLERWAGGRGLRVVLYLCTPAWRDRVRALGYRSFRMGSEAVVDLRAFSLEAPEMAYLRRAERHARGRGVDVRVHEAPVDDGTLEQIAVLNDRWLEGKGIREFRFSQGYVDREYLRSMPLCVAKMNGRVVGFCNVLTAGGAKEGAGGEVMVDLMRSARGVSWSLAHAVWLGAMRWAQAAGYARFNMGMAPLAGTGEGPEATTVERLAGRFARAGGGPIDAGLHEFKAKYRPEWEARYLCWRGRSWLPWVFWQTTSLVLGMSTRDRERIATARSGIRPAGAE